MPPATVIMNPSLSSDGSPPLRPASWLGKRKVGLAMKSTPVRRDDSCQGLLDGKWLLVNISLAKVSREFSYDLMPLTFNTTQHTKAVKVGTRNVMTVASDMSRKERESEMVFRDGRSYAKKNDGKHVQ